MIFDFNHRELNGKTICIIYGRILLLAQISFSNCPCTRLVQADNVVACFKGKTKIMIVVSYFSTSNSIPFKIL